MAKKVGLAKASQATRKRVARLGGRAKKHKFSSMSKKDIKLVDKIIAFETGKMSKTQEIMFLTELKKTGMLFKLQGFYQRTARDYGII